MSIAAVAIAGIIAACFGRDATFATTVEAISVTNPVAFGPVQVMTTSAPMTVTISPSTTMDESFTINAVNTGATCTNFSIDASAIIGSTVSHLCSTGSGTGTASGSGSGSGCTDTTQAFPATFHPQVAGPDSCTVTIVTSGPTLTTQLTGTGVLPDFVLAVGPSPLNFGDVPLGTTSQRTLTFKNSGGKDLSVDSVASGDPRITVAFQTGTIAANTSRQGTVTCAPGATAGLISTTLSIGVTPSTTMTTGVPLQISCNGLDSAIVATPSSVVMPSTLVGVPVTANVTVDIKPGTTGTVVRGTAQIVNDNSNGELTITNAGAGLPSTIALRYAAATQFPNGQLATLRVNYSLNGTAAKLDLSVTGEALPGSLGLAPSTVDLGPVCAGGTATATVTAFANAAGTVELTAIDPPAAPFTLVKPAGMAFPLTLPGGHPAGGDVMLTATVTPTAPMQLASMATLHTNIPGAMGSQPVMLSATALPPGIAATPARVDFGVVSDKLASAPSETITLTNCGSGDLVVSGFHIDGPASNEFGVVNAASEPVARTLAPRESEQILVAMTPRKVGAKTAQLVLEHRAGQTTVELDGSVTGAGGSGGGDKTYYDCSVGRPGALWPIALALFALRRRRR